jgi:hypothetical protein
MHPEDKKKFWNWRWRLRHLYKIRTKKAGEKVPFDPKPAQRRIWKWFGIWDFYIVLKARQVGISTLFLLWHLDATMFTPNTTTCILAHRQDSLKKLFRIIRIAYKSCPDSFRLADGTVWKKPQASYDNANEIYFKDLDSTIYVALEARSDTVHRLHVSEAAHIKDADDVLTATLGAVPDDGGVVSMESTANGMGGVFFEMWEESEQGESQYAPFFVGYQDDPDYSDHVPDVGNMEASLTDEEKDLIANHRHTFGNVAWRRRRKSNAAARKKFAQEFPSHAEEAFLTTGRSPFDRELIKDWIIRKPLESKMEGRLHYWIKPQKGRRYILGCDAASGRGVENLSQEEVKEGGTDYQVIEVWDCETLQLCAAFRGKWPYERLHQIVYQLGREYNDAYVVIEAQDHGLTVINSLVNHVGMGPLAPYPRGMIHTTEVLDEKGKPLTKKWGFYTNLKTRPLVIDHMASLILDGEIRCYWRKMQSECMKFIIDDLGVARAMDGYKDDTVLCCAFTLFCVPNALRAGRMTATKAELGLSGM